MGFVILICNEDGSHKGFGPCKHGSWHRVPSAFKEFKLLDRANQVGGRFKRAVVLAREDAVRLVEAELGHNTGHADMLG